MSRIEEQNKALVRLAAETHNSRDRDAFLACYADQLIVKSPSGEDLVVTPDEHWEAVLTWGRRFEGFAEEIQQKVTSYASDRCTRGSIANLGWASNQPTSQWSGRHGRCCGFRTVSSSRSGC